MLQCFEEDRLFGVAEMADMLGLGRSTGHRYAITLVRFGWLEQTSGRKYRLAHRSAWPGMTVLEEIASLTECDPVLRELRERTRHTASLGVLDGTHFRYVRRYLAHRKGQFEADGELRAGARVPLHCTAMGKALLASLPDGELLDVLDTLELSYRTARTIRARRRLRAQLDQARADGYAFSDRELLGRECSLAAAVAGECRNLRVAVELNAPTASTSVETLIASFGRLVRDATRQIGDKLAAKTAEQAIGKRIPSQRRGRYQ